MRIELYQLIYRKDFVRLNSEWIRKFFHLEHSDHVILNDPEGYILNQGGQIFFAVDDENHAVGCCALVHHADTGSYELAKMAVDEHCQGHGTGYLLGEALLDYARKLGVKKIFLEGNTQLVPSIALYRKLGFHEVPMHGAAYERCNIMMEIELVK